MKTYTLAAASLLLATACGNDDQDHGHDHDVAAGEAHPEQPAPTPAPTPVDDSTLGPWTLTVSHSEGTLVVVAVDSTAAAVTPVGELRAVVTAGGTESRLVLQPGTSGWSAPADLSGDYVAVLSAEIAGSTETARVSGVAGGSTPKADPDDGHGHGDHDH